MSTCCTFVVGWYLILTMLGSEIWSRNSMKMPKSPKALGASKKSYLLGWASNPVCQSCLVLDDLSCLGKAWLRGKKFYRAVIG